MPRGRSSKDYIIYDSEDMPVFVGKNLECANYLGITMNNFYKRVDLVKRDPEVKRNNYVYEIEEEENEEG